MRKAEKKFRLYAVLAVFILLAALLFVINGVNFTMVAEDADRITRMLADHGGAFGRDFAHEGETNKDKARTDSQARQQMTLENRKYQFRPVGPMGPDSPEVDASIRYFTFAFSEDGQTAETIAFQISAVSVEEAAEWAQSLLRESTGWTRLTYRYRVYKGSQGRTFVTVIDQGRELLPSYRILLISIIGGLLCVALSWLALRLVGRRLFSPLAEADRKQKQFIANANREFRVPLTILSADTELLERRDGPSEETRSIRRQIGKLDLLVEKLGSVGIFDDESAKPSPLPLSEYLQAALEAASAAFTAQGKTLQGQVAPDISLTADPEAINKTLAELLDNALLFSRSWASFSLQKEGERIVLETRNDTSLPDGSKDQVFDRFTTLEDSGQEASHAGLGLAFVKDVVDKLNGRASAFVKDGVFTLRIAL